MSKDFLAGLMFAAFGAAGLWLGRGLDKGTASAMGAGYFPAVISLILLVLGLVLAAVALLRAGERPTGWDWRAFIFVILSGAAFAVLLKPIGLVLTLVVTVLLASLGGRLLGPRARAAAGGRPRRRQRGHLRPRPGNADRALAALVLKCRTF